MPDPLIALLIGTLSLAAGLVLFWPDAGLVSRWRSMRRISARVLSEDALKHIHKSEVKGQTPTLQSIAGALQISPNQAAALLADV